MSISKVHELLQNKGCIWTVSILMLLGMVAGSFTQCGRTNEYSRINESVKGAVIAQVGSHEITERLVESEMQRGAQMYGGLSNLPPTAVPMLQASALRGLVGSALQLDLAKKYGIEPTEEDLQKIMEESFNQEIARLKQQMVTQKKLKEGATEAEFAEAFKKETKKDLSQVREEFVDQNMDALRTGTDMRIPVATMAIGEPLLNAIKKEMKLSDDELKKSYDSLQFKRITLTKGDVQATSKKVVAELKGGLSFEKAIDRFSDIPAEPGKKASEKIDPLSRINLRGFEAYQPLEKLKPGEVSEPISIGQSVSIFKLIGIKSDLPKDFDKKKETYRDTQLTSLAAQKLQADLQTAQKDAKIDWKVPAFKWVYEYGRLTAENLNASERSKLEREILTNSVKIATEGEATQARTASGLALAVLQSLESTATPEEKKKLAPEKEKVYEAYLTDNEDARMRLELVQIYKEAKNAEKFSSQLLAAANANGGQVDAQGQSIFTQINKFIKDGQDAKLLTAEQVKDLQAVQDEWKKQKIDQDKIEADIKKADDAAKKAEEAATKAKVKTRDELAKEKDKAKSSGKK